MGTTKNQDSPSYTLVEGIQETRSEALKGLGPIPGAHHSKLSSKADTGETLWKQRAGYGSGPDTLTVTRQHLRSLVLLVFNREQGNMLCGVI